MRPANRCAASLLAAAFLSSAFVAPALGVGYAVTFDLSAPIDNVFVYGYEWNGSVYAWDLFPIPLGSVGAGRTAFSLGEHNVRFWTVLASRSTSGMVTSINDSISPPVGRTFESVFAGYQLSVVESNVRSLYHGAFNTPPAFYLFSFVLDNEDPLKTDRTTGTIDLYAFAGGTGIGSATFGTFCPADFNRDGQTDFFDYLDFAVAFDTGGPAADFNGDAQVDFFDYLDFVQAFDAGC